MIPLTKHDQYSKACRCSIPNIFNWKVCIGFYNQVFFGKFWLSLSNLLALRNRIKSSSKRIIWPGIRYPSGGILRLPSDVYWIELVLVSGPLHVLYSHFKLGLMSRSVRVLAPELFGFSDREISPVPELRFPSPQTGPHPHYGVTVITWRPTHTKMVRDKGIWLF